MGPELTRPFVQNMAKKSFWDRSRWNLFFHEMIQNALLTLFLIFQLSFMNFGVDLGFLKKERLCTSFTKRS